MEEESITDTNNVTTDTFSRASHTQRENENEIFTSDELNKSDKLVDSVKNLKINDAKYYESNTAIASDAQGNPTRNEETVTHTNNGNFGLKLLSYWTIPALPLPTNPLIDQGIAPIVLMPQTFLTSATKEVVVDAASGGAWNHRTPHEISRTGIDGSTSGNICNSIEIA